MDLTLFALISLVHERLTLKDLGHVSKVKGVMTFLWCWEQLPGDRVEDLNRCVHDSRR